MAQIGYPTHDFICNAVFPFMTTIINHYSVSPQSSLPPQRSTGLQPGPEVAADTGTHCAPGPRDCRCLPGGWVVLGGGLCYNAIPLSLRHTNQMGVSVSYPSVARLSVIYFLCLGSH